MFAKRKNTNTMKEHAKTILDSEYLQTRRHGEIETAGSRAWIERLFAEKECSNLIVTYPNGEVIVTLHFKDKT